MYLKVRVGRKGRKSIHLLACSPAGHSGQREVRSFILAPHLGAGPKYLVLQGAGAEVQQLGAPLGCLH